MASLSIRGNRSACGALGNSAETTVLPAGYRATWQDRRGWEGAVVESAVRRLDGRYLPGAASSRSPIHPRGPFRMPSRDINVIALVKGSERYVFLFDDESRAEAIKTLGRYAADPELSFSWYDAAVLGHKLRQSGTRAARTRFVPPADHAA